ncbi:unnamed protein product [Phytophthora fragariaefolia]|uniref:Unnamed protein product n=1 Tax=Phytophthora fragariaefolia TaxID=1490495 RepID=A0A9W7CFQ8_9STRA|nr:unnamed protein product [Phytophthora fragariaefolia]
MTEASLSQSQPTTPFAGGITMEEKKRFQSDIARGFYAAGLPFRAIEVPRMRRALTILQPDMEKYLPTRKALASKLLSDEYQREKDELIARLRDEPTLDVVSDGWSSISNEKVVHYIVVSPRMRPLLWCTRRTGEAEQTAEYVAQEIGSVIDEINLVAGRLSVVSVTTDNAPVMPKTGDILERERQGSCNGCSSHALNLILEECIESGSDNQRIIAQLFRQKKFMKRFGRKPAKLNEVRFIVDDKEFWKRLKLVQMLLGPLVEAIAMLEQDTCCISLGTGSSASFSVNLAKMIPFRMYPEACKQAFGSRPLQSGILHTDAMGVSFLLDQTKPAAEFVDAELTKTVKSVKAIARRMGVVSTPAEESQIGAEATDFYTKREGWSSETRADYFAVSPLAWWTDKCGKDPDQTKHYYPLLARLAVMIFTIPTSSASSERSWSIQDFIHTKRRNRLDARRVEKLVFIYSNAGDKDAKTNIFYQLNEDSESEDDDDEGDTTGDDSRAGWDDSNASPSYSNSYSYDGNEEHKFES